ncbi:heterokaryon incompatibility protein-domain-containing protein [Apiospora sp. TS-2023a]
MLGEKVIQSTFPPTIEDAINVTIQLGFSYLWVDRYCIDQTDEAHKTSQIQQMGHIYNQAALTIIAAAGADPTYGLPGVSRARMSLSGAAVIKPLYSFGYDKYECIPTPANPISHARGSVWAKRGWTYQEAFLCRRRLFFTDAQTLFECGQNICEEIAFYKWYHQSDYGESVLRREMGSTPIRSLNSVVQNICDYSSRELGFVQDRLRAFLGILASYALGPTPIYHLWGVPVDSQDGEWYLYLILLDLTPSARNPEFPSWSWLGWTSRLSATARPVPLSATARRSRLYSTASVKVEENGQAVDLSPTLLQRYYSVENNPEAAPVVLQLKSMTFPVYAVPAKLVPVHKLVKPGWKTDGVPDMVCIPHWTGLL